MAVCLQRGADLHMAQLMPLPLTVCCSSKIQIGFTFMVPAYPGSPGQRAVKQACVCVYNRLADAPTKKCSFPNSLHPPACLKFGLLADDMHMLSMLIVNYTLMQYSHLYSHRITARHFDKHAESLDSSQFSRQVTIPVSTVCSTLPAVTQK